MIRILLIAVCDLCPHVLVFLPCLCADCRILISEHAPPAVVPMDIDDDIHLIVETVVHNLLNTVKVCIVDLIIIASVRLLDYLHHISPGDRNTDGVDAVCFQSVEKLLCGYYIICIGLVTGYPLLVRQLCLLLCGKSGAALCKRLLQRVSDIPAKPHDRCDILRSKISSHETIILCGNAVGRCMLVRQIGLIHSIGRTRCSRLKRCLCRNRSYNRCSGSGRCHSRCSRGRCRCCRSLCCRSLCRRNLCRSVFRCFHGYFYLKILCNLLFALFVNNPGSDCRLSCLHALDLAVLNSGNLRVFRLPGDLRP